LRDHGRRLFASANGIGHRYIRSRRRIISSPPATPPPPSTTVRAPTWPPCMRVGGLAASPTSPCGHGLPPQHRRTKGSTSYRRPSTSPWPTAGAILHPRRGRAPLPTTCSTISPAATNGPSPCS
jgi:hypothetical protein